MTKRLPATLRTQAERLVPILAQQVEAGDMVGGNVAALWGAEDERHAVRVLWRWLLLVTADDLDVRGGQRPGHAPHLRALTPLCGGGAHGTPRRAPGGRAPH